MSQANYEGSSEDFAGSWDEAVEDLHQAAPSVDSPEISVTLQEEAKETENLFEAARW